MKRKILMTILVLVALGALGGGGIFLGKKMGSHGAAQPEAQPQAAAPAVEAPSAPSAHRASAADDDNDDDLAPSGGEEGAAGSPVVLQLSRLIVNLDTQRRNAFLKCDIHILFRDQELGKEATSDKPTPENSIIRSIVLDALSGKTVAEASDIETRESVRQEIKQKLNERFANHRSLKTLEEAKKSGRRLKPPIMDVLVVDWAIQQ